MACRNELVVKVNRGGFSIENMRGIQFEQVLRLRTLNRFSARLSSLIHASNGVAPFEMYIEFMQLFAELTALRPDRDQFEVIEYEHDNPAIAFNELSIRIRDVLPGIKEPIYDKVPFTMDQEQKIMIATLSDTHLSKPKEYFIAIQTKRDPSELAELVLDRDKFKLMPLSLATQRVFGVKLRRELYPPLELPSPPELYYFRVMRSESARLWERIQQEKSIAVRWPGIESSDLKVTLYMTLPHEEP
jgi:predicted component of type VI protein secretion system